MFFGRLRTFLRCRFDRLLLRLRLLGRLRLALRRLDFGVLRLRLLGLARRRLLRGRISLPLRDRAGLRVDRIGLLRVGFPRGSQLCDLCRPGVHLVRLAE